MLVFTSCTANYIPKARVLARSLKKWHPDWEFCLLLGDSLPEGVYAADEPFDRIMGFEELQIPDYKIWLFLHRVVEICTAVKGQAMNYFLEKEKREKVIYLDPDIMVFNSLEPLNKALDAHSILLTPHQLAPQNTPQAIEDNEICSLRHGVYNLGFLACAARDQGIAFSRFWRDRLRDYCYDDKENGLFTDQRWCDLAPAYFSDLEIVRDPGCNAASWNLTDRTILRENDIFLANGQPLRFYHFTGYDSGMGKIMSSIYGARMPAVKELWDLYDRNLREAGHENMKKLPWSGNFYSNGEKITDEARFYMREHPDIYPIFPDPFATDAQGDSGFRGYWRELKNGGENRAWAIARKPFRLAQLTGKYLARNGGARGIPHLWRRVSNVYRQGGLQGLLEKVRAFKRKTGVGSIRVSLANIQHPQNQILRQWNAILSQSFSQGGVLLLDHMYGGGANDYREKRIKDFLDQGRPVLLLTWDFFNGFLRADARLPGDKPRRLEFEADSLAGFLDQDIFHFDYILINELVLWSRPEEKRNHHFAIPSLLDAILEIKHKNQAFLEFDAHDFYAACPNYVLLKNDREYCGLEADEKECAACLAKTRYGLPRGFDLTAWRGGWQKLFDNADEIRFFSNAALEIMRKKFRVKEGQAKVLPHKPLLDFNKKIEIPKSGPLRIGVIGHIAWHKGAGIVAEMAKMLKEDETLTVLGELDGDAPDNVAAHGSYGRGELPELLERYGITATLVPSIWPETFCYTAQECMELGMPLVVFPLGAQAERAAGYSKGKVAENVSAEAALKALRELDQERRK